MKRYIVEPPVREIVDPSAKAAEYKPPKVIEKTRRLAEMRGLQD